LDPKSLLSYEKLNHLLTCYGYLDEGLKDEISSIRILGFDLIV